MTGALTIAQLLVLGGTVLLAAVVRGYAGFGFSALVVTSMALFYPPAELVPMVLLLEIAASIHMLPLVWRSVQWRAVAWLMAGMVVCVPLGQALLRYASPDTMRAIVSLMVLVAVALLWRGVRFALGTRQQTFALTGLISGLMNGVAAMGGLGVMVMFLSTRLPVATARASLVALFFLGDLYASLIAAANGLLTHDIALRAAWMLIPLTAGVTIGNRRFVRTAPASFRRFALALLSALALAGLGRSLYTLFT